MVGRDASLVAADAALDRALSGSGGLVLVSGPAGIGKTRLAQAIADRAAARAVPQAWGFAVDDKGAPPLWPWRRGLRDITEIDGLLDIDRSAAPAGDPSARFQLFTDICDRLIRHAAAHGFVVVLEDLHWADGESLALLEQVANEIPRSRLLLVGTYRPRDRDALDATLSRVIRGPGVTHLSLAGLTPTDIDGWLRQLPDTPAGSLAGDLHERTGGNPLLVRLVTQALQAAPPGAAGEPLDRLLIDRPDVRRLIASRTAALSRPARQILDAASVLGERCALATLTDVMDAPGHSTAAAVAEAVDAGILREASGEPELEFTHALVRDAVYAELRPAERAAWHRRCATALQNADVPAPAGIVAGHWHRAGGADATAHCMAAARAAADEAETAYAYPDACRFQELAVRCATELPIPDDEVARLTLRLAELLFAAGSIEASLSACATASDIAFAARCSDLMVAAGLVVQGIGTPEVNRSVRRLCRRALSAVGNQPSVARARLLAQIAAATAEDEGGPLAEQLSARALAVAEQTADPTAVLEAIAARHLAISVPDMVAQRLELGRRAVELGSTSQRPMAALWGHLWRVDAAFQLGNIPEVDREVAEIDRIATGRRSPLARWHWYRLLAARAALLGDFPTAREHNRAAGALAARMGDLSLAGMSHAFSSQLAFVRGDSSELPSGFREILARTPPMPLVLISGTIASALEGDLSAARASFASFRELPRTFPYGTKWAATIAQIGLAAVLLDDTEVAEAVYTALAPTALYYSGDGSGALFSHGANAGLIGTLAMTAGRVDEAVPLLRDAVAMNARIGARPATALARLALAQALLARQRPTTGGARPHDQARPKGARPYRQNDDGGGDVVSARTLLADAAAEFGRLDMPGPLSRARALQTECAAPTGPALSARETEIAALVAQSLSNRAIAERLFVSERTVESHVRNILTKLGFASRTEIAVWAARQDAQPVRKVLG